MTRVAIIGMGFGKNVHVPAFRKDSRCEVAAICGTSLSRTQSAAKELSISKFSDDWRKFTDDKDIDVISIAAPPALQGEIITRALENNKHVFCEKPLGTSYNQAIQLARLADKKNLAHMIDFEFPQLITWRVAKEQLASLGKIKTVNVVWESQSVAFAKNLDIWKVDPARGGGTLQNLVTHTLYYLEWFLGPIAKLEANLHTKEEPVDLTLVFQDGTQSKVRVSANSPKGAGHILEFQGTKADLTLENRDKDYMKGFSLTAPKNSIKEPVNNEDGRVNAVGGVVKQFLDWIHEGHRQTPNLWDGARNELLLEKTRESHQLKTSVEIPNEPIH